MAHDKVGPREMQLRQLAQMTRAGKNQRAAARDATIAGLKEAMAKTSEAMVKPKAKGKARKKARA